MSTIATFQPKSGTLMQPWRAPPLHASTPAQRRTRRFASRRRSSPMLGAPPARHAAMSGTSCNVSSSARTRVAFELQTHRPSTRKGTEMKALTRISISACLAAAGMGSFGGCSHRQSAEPTMAPASGSFSEREDAIQRISVTRCERDQRCGNIGPDKSYASLDDCEASRDRDARASSNDCKQGVNHDRLSECLSAIRAEDCGSPLDSLERIVACRNAPCMK